MGGDMGETNGMRTLDGMDKGGPAMERGAATRRAPMLACAGLLAAALLLAAAATTPGMADASSADADLADCASCHTAEAASFDEGVESLAALHGTLAGECTDCHDTSDRGFAIVHRKTEGKDLPTQLRRTKASAEVCSTCHDQADLAEATADVKLVDEKGTEVNPHDLPSNESHDALTCFDCHGFHGVSAGEDEGDATAEDDGPAAEDGATEEGAAAEGNGPAAGESTGTDDATEESGPAASGPAASGAAGDPDGAAQAADAPGTASTPDGAPSEDDPLLADAYGNASSLCLSCHHAGVFECGTCH